MASSDFCRPTTHYRHLLIDTEQCACKRPTSDCYGSGLTHHSSSRIERVNSSVEERSGKILARPERHEMEAGVEEQLIVEFYSR